MISFYPQVLRGDEPITAERALTWVLSILAGQATVFAVLVIARRLWWHRAWARCHPAVAVWSFILATFAGVMVANTVASPLLTEAGSLSFGFDHLLLGSLTLIIIGSGIVAVRQHRDAVRELQETQAVLLASVQRGEEVLIEERQATLRKAQESVDHAIHAVQSSSPDTVAALNAASEDVLRPLSHELAYASDQLEPVDVVTPQPRWRDVVTQVTTSPLIAPGPTAIVMLILASRLSVTDGSAQSNQVEQAIGDSTIGVSVDLASVGQSLTELASVFAGTWLAAWLVVVATRPLLRRFGTINRWIITGASVLVVALLSQSFTIGLFSTLGLETTINYSLPIRLALLLPIAAITGLVGLVRAVNVAQVDVRDELNRTNQDLEWQLARLNQCIWDQRQGLALGVHGPLRAALIASAMEFANAESTTDPRLIKALTERIFQAQGDFIDPPERTDPFASLTQLQELWAGTCTIDIDVDQHTADQLAADPLTAQVATKVVDEAVANAIAHGNASTILVSLEAGDDSLQITVTNDGTRPESDTRTGLGTAFINDVSLSWELRPLDASTTLHARLPLAAAGEPERS